MPTINLSIKTKEKFKELKLKLSGEKKESISEDKLENILIDKFEEIEK